MTGTPMRATFLLAALLIAGQGWAGEAWIATYTRHTAAGDCELTLVQSPTLVEYRGCAQPPRLWRRLGDGVELLELHPDDDKLVRYSPGDLRASQREPEWAQVAGLVPGGLIASLNAIGEAQAFDQRSERYRGKDAGGRDVELEWLPDPGLPARYRVHGDRGMDFKLKHLQRKTDAEAFTPTAGLHEIDGADLGD